MDRKSQNCNGGVSATEQWQEIEIEVPWGVVCGKWWGPRSIQPILAIHGWQDNAGTFDRLCPLICGALNEYAILCIDLPGHGKSSHYPQGIHYYLFWDGISLIRRIVKKFEWEKITLLGHSLGGALSFMYAASFPDDVNRFISIDIAGPTVRDHIRSASMTGETIDRFLKYEQLPPSKLPCYKYDEMIDLVVDAYDGSIDRDSAKILMRRGMATAPEKSVSTKDGYHFARDIRLKVSLMGMFSLEQVLAYAEQIKCEVLNLRAVPGMRFDNETVYPAVIKAMRKNSKRLIYQEVPGTHHVHLQTPNRILNIILEFLST